MIFPNILAAIKHTRKVRIFLIPLSLAFLNVKSFLFYTKNSLALGVKCEKLNFRISV